MENQQPEELQEKVLHIRRVSRKTPGGNYVTFSALVAVGDQKGKLGIGMAKALEVPIAIEKAEKQAKKKIIKIALKGTTIPYDIMVKYKAAKILLKPAPPGTGLKVGSVIRPLMELVGIKDLSGKIYGSANRISLSLAIYKALGELQK